MGQGWARQGTLEQHGRQHHRNNSNSSSGTGKELHLTASQAVTAGAAAAAARQQQGQLLPIPQLQTPQQTRKESLVGIADLQIKN